MSSTFDTSTPATSALGVPLARPSARHFAPVEGTVLDLESLQSLAWGDHDGLWTALLAHDGTPRGLVVDGLQLRRRESKHYISPGRCLIPLRHVGRLVHAELREPLAVRMDFGVLVLRATGAEVREHGARASSEIVSLEAVVVPFAEVEVTDLPLEYNRDEQGRVDSYRDLRRLDRPDQPRVERHVLTYRKLVGLVWASGGDGEATTGQAVVNLSMGARVQATAALEAAVAVLKARPSTSAARIRLHDGVKEVFRTMEDHSADRVASRRLLNELADLACDHSTARDLAGVGGAVG